MKKLIALVLALVLTLSIAATASASVYDGQRVRVVIGSTAVSGDSYMVADTVCRYLSKYLNANLKVDPVGANAAFEAVKNAKPDGLEFMIFHDMTYLGVLFGSYDEEYALENMVVGPRVGQNPGSCFAAKKDAEYNDMKEMAEWLKADASRQVRISVELGGVSNIGFIVYYMWVVEAYGQDVADRIHFVVGGSTDKKLQQLWDGNTDVIFADYSSLLQYTREGVDAQLAVKFVGLLDKVEGIEAPVMGDLGITLAGEPFYFAKDFLIYLPAGTPDEVVAELDAAVEKLAADEEFQAEMAKLTYVGNTLLSAEAKDFIYAKRDAIAEVLADAPALEDLE